MTVVKKQGLPKFQQLRNCNNSIPSSPQPVVDQPGAFSRSLIAYLASVCGVLKRCKRGGADGNGGAMGAALAAACARVEQPAATGDQTEGLQAFDRALLAQADFPQIHTAFMYCSTVDWLLLVVSLQRDVSSRNVGLGHAV